MIQTSLLATDLGIWDIDPKVEVLQYQDYRDATATALVGEPWSKDVCLFYKIVNGLVAVPIGPW